LTTFRDFWLTADVHLVALRDAFLGYVLQSKIHACIE
jgi:hypothetical protein